MPTEKQMRSRERAFNILRLRGMAAMASFRLLFSQEESTQIISCIDEALKRLGARTTAEQRVHEHARYSQINLGDHL